MGEEAAERFVAMMIDTWTTTMTPGTRGVFVITGDIPAMWLRDSSAQVLPFLRLVDVPEVADVLRGIIERQWACIALDPYANAFNDGPTGAHFDPEDLELDPGVWERKYEIDSLGFPIDLAHRLWQATGSADHLDDAVHAGCRTIVDLWRTEQHHFERSTYRHVRDSEPGDTLGPDGRGIPVGYTGMTWSGFRPSDDACVYGYNIPAQLMAVRALRQVGEFAVHWGDDALGADAAQLAVEISDGVAKFGVVEGRYAYEVDGLGGQLFMDDANMPSLLSLPLTSDVAADDPIYRATRAWVLSPANPYFYEGAAARGIGSPHTPPDYVWHIALAVQGLTGDAAEARQCLATILATDGGTGWTHEGFHVDNPKQFTRPWFSWSNSMACELMMTLSEG
ncbi:glycoside hydrolase family 125 protein [Tessaracoccus massiliensis]|uniref:glycoside hydrolase family 125 protein n=1 Tax=Tessaracoccus massiliensis TaxID=1522311 RepID=UPI0009E354D0